MTSARTASEKTPGLSGAQEVPENLEAVLDRWDFLYHLPAPGVVEALCGEVLEKIGGQAEPSKLDRASLSNKYQQKQSVVRGVLDQGEPALTQLLISANIIKNWKDFEALCKDTYTGGVLRNGKAVLLGKLFASGILPTQEREAFKRICEVFQSLLTGNEGSNTAVMVLLFDYNIIGDEEDLKALGSNRKNKSCFNV